VSAYVPKPAKVVVRFGGVSVVNEQLSNSAARALARAVKQAQSQHERIYHSPLKGDDLADLLTALLTQHVQEEEPHHD